MGESNRTEKPTPRRRQKAREKGQVARSRDLISSCAAMAALLVVAAQAPAFAGKWRMLLGHTLAEATTSEMGSPTSLLNWDGYLVLQSAGLVLLLSWMTALLAAFVQGGLVFSPVALQP